MISILVNEEDYRELKVALDKTMPGKLVTPELDTMGRNVVGVMRPYPAGPYQRTGHLGQSWYNVMHGYTLDLGDTADYSGYVVGDYQRVYHAAHGWKRVFDVIEQQLSVMVDRIERKLESIWR